MRGKLLSKLAKTVHIIFSSLLNSYYIMFGNGQANCSLPSSPLGPAPLGSHRTLHNALLITTLHVLISINLRVLPLLCHK